MNRKVVKGPEIDEHASLMRRYLYTGVGRSLVSGNQLLSEGEAQVFERTTSLFEPRVDCPAHVPIFPL